MSQRHFLLDFLRKKSEKIKEVKKVERSKWIKMTEN